MSARINNPSSPYIWGLTKAAQYLGVSRKTFWRIRNSNTTSAEEKKLLQPRIIHGSAAFRKTDLDRFMSPAMNAPGAKIHDPFPHE